MLYRLCLSTQRARPSEAVLVDKSEGEKGGGDGGRAVGEYGTTPE